MGVVAQAADPGISLIHFLVVAGLGAFVGMGELVARYRDAPAKAIRAPAAAVYLGINVGASVAALALARVFGWKFGVSSGGDALLWTQVLVSGFGAMALFRSSLFLIRIGNQDVAVGPNAFLQVMLRASDAGVDRHRATARAKVIGGLMKEVSFQKAHRALPSYCLALMQNVAEDDQRKLAAQVAALVPGTEPTDTAKAQLLGLALMNIVGEDVLKAAIASLGNDIKGTVAPAPGP